MFILEKVKVLENHYTRVASGEMFAGRELNLWDWRKDAPPLRIHSVLEIEPDHQVILNDGTYIRTSMIQEIVDSGIDNDTNAWVIFRTETSIYRCREVSDV